MKAAMCQALPRFYSDYNNKSLFSVFSELYEKKHSKPRLWRVYSRFFLFLGKLQVSINFNRNLFLADSSENRQISIHISRN